MGHKRPTGALVLRWMLYTGLLMAAGVLQTAPSLSIGHGLKPIFILPVCLAVALYEGGFAGAIFGTVGGLLWDVASGRVTGFFALLLVLVCFTSACLWQLYLRNTWGNFVIVTVAATLFVLSVDFLVFYFLRNYPLAAWRFVSFVLPEVAITAAVGVPIWWLVKKISGISVKNTNNKR